MTSAERRFRHRLRAANGRGRFKDRPVLVAFGMLALVLLVFGAGMATAYYRDSWARPPRDERSTHLRQSDTASTEWLFDYVRREYPYRPSGW